VLFRVNVVRMTAKSLLLNAVRLWIFAAVAVLLSTFLIGAAGAPRRLELPWSQFNDFVAGSDESVYIYARAYGRVLRYDSSGHFVASYPAPEWGYGELATDISGHIYFRIINRVYVYDRDWNQLDAKAGNFYGNRMWLVNDQGQLQEAAPGRSADPRADRAVSAGGMLFSSVQTDPRHQFTLMDGSHLERRGDRLIKYAPNGQVVLRYGTPWYLWWAKFPVPAASGWVLALIWAVLKSGKIGPSLSPRIGNRKQGAR
jgi:hypothetical protein